VKVDVQVERPTKALNDGQGATLAVAHTEPVRSLALEGEQSPDISGEDGATQAWSQAST
jgi:hypothetical protein